MCNENNNRRIIGLDIIRVLSMFGIIGLHVINNGGVLSNIDIHSLKYYVVLSVNILFFTSVDIFAMLSGYLNVSKEKNKNSRIVELLFILFFYCIIIPVIFYGVNLVNVRSLGIFETIMNIFPILAGRYWYITCYVFLFFMIPYINLFIKNMDKNKLKKFLIVCFIFLAIVPNIVGMVDVFRVNNGYSPFWLIYCYIIGAYIKLYRNEKQNTKIIKRNIIIYFAAALIINVCIRNVSFLFLKRVVRGEWFINYISPFIILLSVNLLLYFKDFNIRSIKLNKIVMYLSSASFSVYIIHGHKLIYDYILKNNFSFLCKYNGIVIFVGILLSIICIYAICVVIDIVRKFIFKYCKINHLIECVGRKIDNILN